jgi:hypothetical protein
VRPGAVRTVREGATADGEQQRLPHYCIGRILREHRFLTG